MEGRSEEGEGERGIDVLRGKLERLEARQSQSQSQSPSASQSQHPSASASPSPNIRVSSARIPPFQSTSVP